MTKEMYLEMCKTLGTQPIAEEMPPDFSDLTQQGQLAVEIFGALPTMYNALGGYSGRDISVLDSILNLYGIEDKLTYFELITILNVAEIKQVNNQIQSNINTKANKGDTSSATD